MEDVAEEKLGPAQAVAPHLLNVHLIPVRPEEGSTARLCARKQNLPIRHVHREENNLNENQKIFGTAWPKRASCQNVNRVAHC